MTPTCLVARAGPCDAESPATQEDDHAALCWQALRTTVTGQPGSTHRKAMPIRQPLEMPGRYCFHSTRPAPWKRVSAALSIDRQSKSGVNFRRTRRRCFSVWLSRSGKAWEDRPDRAVRHPLRSQGTPHRFATVAVRYAEALLSTFGVAAVRRPPRSRAPFR